MKPRQLIALIAALGAMCAEAQTVEHNWNDYHARTATALQRAMPLPYVRESDVIWELVVWRTIDLHEEYNQFMYFPLDIDDPSGKINLANLFWVAVANGEIPIYEDDELKIPIDNELFVRNYTKPDTIRLEIGYDDDESEEYQTIIRPREFDAGEILQFSLKEAWFIDKQDDRQFVRAIAIAPYKDEFKMFGSEEVYMGRLPIFWVPLQSTAVRNVMASHVAYYQENNIALQPSWDHIFTSHDYSSFVTRETNRFNRTIASYLTGEDAIMESDRIEAKLLDISMDMWEY
ncbi:MAG: gliding motility protein GldN [Bacteroidales bacterium]|nr:gliding motility protein GldN [Bacteroidales bacterium]